MTITSFLSIVYVVTSLPQLALLFIFPLKMILYLVWFPALALVLLPMLLQWLRGRDEDYERDDPYFTL